MRRLAAILFVLVLIGAGSQCIADCFPHPSVPPCHQHSQGKNSSPEPCKHAQPAADAQVVCPPASDTPPLGDVTLLFFAPAVESIDNVRSSFGVLRL